MIFPKHKINLLTLPFCFKKEYLMKFKFFIPLIAFFLPTWVITWFRWPDIFKAHPQQNMESLIGMFIMWFFVGLTYYQGIRAVIKDRDQTDKR